MERVRRIELLASDWKSEVLPLYDTRFIFFDNIVKQVLMVHTIPNNAMPQFQYRDVLSYIDYTL